MYILYFTQLYNLNINFYYMNHLLESAKYSTLSLEFSSLIYCSWI